MKRVLRTVRRQATRARGAERFVRLIVGGGGALVAGLWTVTLAPAGSPAWLLGIALALLGVGGLAAGIGSAVDP